VAERAAALGVRLPLRYPLAVEVSHLLKQVVVLKQDRTVGSYRQRVLVALDRDAGIVGRGRPLVLGHGLPFVLIT
jgi:hypothetical protein